MDQEQPVCKNEAITDEADTPKEQPDTPLASDVELEIFKSVPNTMKNRAQLLVKKRKNNKDLVGLKKLDWSIISGSNIIDLVNDALRQRKGLSVR